MTKEITKAYIIQQIQDKLGLRDMEPERFRFSEQVIPIYNIESHLQRGDIISETKSVTSAPYAHTFFLVPENQRWTLRTYNIIFMAAGAYKVTGLFITRARSGGSQLMYLDMKLGQTVSYVVDLPKAVLLYPGDKINIYIDDYTSTADLRVYADVTKEDIR